MPTAKGEFGCVTFDSEIFVIGGSDATGSTSNCVEAYCPKLNQWRICSTMSVKRYSPGVSIRIQLSIFFFTKLFHFIIIHTSKMSVSFDKKYYFIYELQVAKIGRFIYAVGGRTLENNTNISSAERYDPKRDVWSFIESLSTPRYGLGLAAMGSNLIAVGEFHENV